MQLKVDTELPSVPARISPEIGNEMQAGPGLLVRGTLGLAVSGRTL